MTSPKERRRDSTGVPVLDDIVSGGLPKGEMYVAYGKPGTGKTILALHFLQAGIQAGEKVLCLTLSQRVESVQETAASVGIDATKMVFIDLSSARDLHVLAEQQTVFDNSEVELEDTMIAFTRAIEAEQPDRIVFDGISHLRMLANHTLAYRQQLFALRDYLTDRDITAVFTSTIDVLQGDRDLIAIAHGAIALSTHTTDHGLDHRYLHITKIRGSSYQPGRHDMEISAHGMRVYPSHKGLEKIGPEKRAIAPHGVGKTIISGMKALDTMLGDGLLGGTSCLLVGPSGAGKTTTATLFAHNFAQQGGKIGIFLFDELTGTFLKRSKALGIDIKPFVDKDQVHFHELSFGDVTPGKFTDLVAQDVEDWGAGIIIIDTLTGYFNSMPSRKRLVSQIHELLMSLNRRGVLTFLVVAQHGVVGPDLSVAMDVSYLADTVLLLRHFEADGALRQAISVYKKRYGTHSKRIRELRLRPGGIQIGPPLTQFTGILSGMPRYTGEFENLMSADE